MTGGRLAPDELPPAVIEAAVGWMVRLQSGGATPQDHRACEQWQRERPEHAQAWASLNAFSTRMKALPPTLARSALAASREAARPPRRRAVFKGLVLVAGTSGIGLAASPDGGWRSLTASHRTGVGERRRVALADGSVIQMNTATALNARIDAMTRCVQLYAGEILVECARDAASPARPFLVQTAQGAMESDAGRFLVRQLAGRTLVQAIEGWGEVRPGGEDASRRRLAAGHQWVFDAHGGGPVSQPDAADGAAGAWVDGLLVARDMPLAELVGELARYRRGWLRCDEAVAGLRISGVFPIDDLERVLAAIQRTLPVRIRRIGSWVVSLERR